MNAEMLQENLRELLDEVLAVSVGTIDPEDISLPEDFGELIRVETFLDAGVFSNNPGLVLRFNQGGNISEFQLSLVRSR